VHGIRVSELTGKCEKTTSDNIKEAGYSYAETVIMDKKFTKPVEVSHPQFQFFNSHP
jgi:hypothetical protein